MLFRSRACVGQGRRKGSAREASRNISRSGLAHYPPKTHSPTPPPCTLHKLPPPVQDIQVSFYCPSPSRPIDRPSDKRHRQRLTNSSAPVQISPKTPPLEHSHALTRQNDQHTLPLHEPNLPYHQQNGRRVGQRYQDRLPHSRRRGGTPRDGRQGQERSQRSDAKRRCGRNREEIRYGQRCKFASLFSACFHSTTYGDVIDPHPHATRCPTHMY